MALEVEAAEAALKDGFHPEEVTACLRLTWCFYFQVLKLAKNQVEMEAGCEHQ